MGKPIAEHQLDRGEARRHGDACEAARGLLYRFGRMVDEGVDGAELTKASAMAKLFCTDTRWT
jgi:alkylation response protein AidB-like acyl-CoA dehydrogenase